MFVKVHCQRRAAVCSPATRKHLTLMDMAQCNISIGLSQDFLRDIIQSADGIICSTPTGSTAYSLAAGGPLLAPMLDGVTLVPVAPHTLSNRPIVLPGESSIDIEITESRDAVAYFDMQEFADVQPGDVLKIRPSQRTFTMLHPIGYDYFDLLRRKLKWNFMPTSSRQDPNDGKNG